MTTTVAPPPVTAPVPVTRSGAAPLRLIKAELLKLWTTNSWWIFGVLALATTGLALLINIFQADSEISYAEQRQQEPPPQFGPVGPDGQPVEGGPSPEDVKRMQDEYYASIDVGKILVRSAANILTSGQYFGLLFMVILGALVITNEYYHQTATATFLTTPHRTAVILSKLAAASLLAAGFWLITTVIDLAAASLYVGAAGYDLPLGDWPVVRSILMNLLVYVIWAVLGVGLGVLIRSQLGATLTGSAFYLLSLPVAFIAFSLIREFVIKEDWVFKLSVAVPGVASQVMISPEPPTLGYSSDGPIVGPAWWVGALVLVGYGLVAGLVGTLITRRRDIS